MRTVLDQQHNADRRGFDGVSKDDLDPLFSILFWQGFKGGAQRNRSIGSVKWELARILSDDP
jgi:hypothetical protein